MAKGSSFERKICKQLSLWWTKGKREDVFWRTAGSGARATVRSKLNKQTFGQHGDIQATDPIGQKLIDMFCFELKRGYSKETFANLIEVSERPKVKSSGFDSFILQAIQSRKGSGSKFWALITKRDRKVPMIFLPYKFILLLKNHVDCKQHTPYSLMRCPLSNKKIIIIFGTPLDNFIKITQPKYIKKILSDWYK